MSTPIMRERAPPVEEPLPRARSLENRDHLAIASSFGQRQGCSAGSIGNVHIHAPRNEYLERGHVALASIAPVDRRGERGVAALVHVIELGARSDQRANRQVVAA